MLAEKSPTLNEATKTVYNTTADLCAQTMLEAYEEYEKVYRTIKREAEEEVAQSPETLAQKKEELAQCEATIAQQQERIAFLEAQLSTLQSNQ